MRVLIVIGAGASRDSWRQTLDINHAPSIASRLPLANDLFSSMTAQNTYLQQYNLVGIAGKLRKIAVKNEADKTPFNIEKELAKLFELATQLEDKNRFHDFFAIRFYIQALIWDLTNHTLHDTSSHTVYLDMINDLKDWTDVDRDNRIVDLVVFNYDNLIEKAMETVYSYDWRHKGSNPLDVYYSGRNLKMYKPHGSIDWGREILNENGAHAEYYDDNQIIEDYSKLTLADSFQRVDPPIFRNSSIIKRFVPAIAIPFNNKTDFQDCPQEMQAQMLEAINNADHILTLGWKGGDENFTKLLKSNGKKIKNIYVVSPEGRSELEKDYPAEIFKPFKSTFYHFVSTSGALKSVLNEMSISSSVSTSGVK